MFTGIIEDVIKLERIKREGRSASLHLQLAFDAKIGESVSINGVCLTVESVYGRISIFRAVPETLKKTNLSLLKPGDWVNIERSLKIGDSIGGHFVYGHIDGMGELVDIQKTHVSAEITVEYPSYLRKFIARKGSVALDGISLTVLDVSDYQFKVAIVPYTMDNTNLQYRKRGDCLNIEVDALARYINRIREATNE
ncbi:Riboflavin synthase [subsurface metagenome]